MVALLADPMTAPVPADLLPWQVRALARSRELAITRGLRLNARGVCKLPAHRGAPIFIVSSGSGGRAHLLWISGRRIHCDCKARIEHHWLTCSHAQFVHLLLVAERAAAAFVTPTPEEPAPVAPVAPEPDPDPTPDPTPSGPRGPRCPTCAGPVDPTELDELGECLACLLMRADYERAEREAIYAEAAAATQLPCWACGAIATAETSDGLYCDDCASLPQKERRTRARARQKQLAQQLRAEKAKEETAARIIAREKARERVGIPSEASPRYKTKAKTETARRAAEKEAARQKQPQQSAELTRAEQLAQSLRLVGIKRDIAK